VGRLLRSALQALHKHAKEQGHHEHNFTKLKFAYSTQHKPSVICQPEVAADYVLQQPWGRLFN